MGTQNNNKQRTVSREKLTNLQPDMAKFLMIVDHAEGATGLGADLSLLKLVDAVDKFIDSRPLPRRDPPPAARPRASRDPPARIHPQIETLNPRNLTSIMKRERDEKRGVF